MKRRSALRALCAGTIAVAIGAAGQRPRLPVVGVLYGASSEEWPERFAALQKGLAELGYVEGQNVTFDVRLLEGRHERAPEAARELASRNVAVIVATGGPRIALAAKAATAIIPIVVTYGGDPVTAGLVATLNRPGANVTGVTILTVELAAKLLDVFHETLPKATTVALLVNPDNPVSGAYADAIRAAAAPLGLRVDVLMAGSAPQIDEAFATLAEHRASGLLVGADPFFEIRRDQLIGLAERQRVPTFYFVREFVERGGLASYGASFNDAVREAGNYAGRILKGAKPADLPFLEPTKFELVLNLKAARVLGIPIPQSLRLRADEVIQ